MLRDLNEEEIKDGIEQAENWMEKVNQVFGSKRPVNASLYNYGFYIWKFTKYPHT